MHLIDKRNRSKGRNRKKNNSPAAAHKIYTSGSNYNNTVLYVQHLFDRFSRCCCRWCEYIGCNLPKRNGEPSYDLRRPHDCQTLTYTLVLLPASVRSNKIDCREHGCRSKWKWSQMNEKEKCTNNETKRNETESMKTMSTTTTKTTKTTTWSIET